MEMALENLLNSMSILNNAYFLNDTFTHLFSLNYQQVINGSTLDSSETISLGGPYGVRAYNNEIML